MAEARKRDVLPDLLKALLMLSVLLQHSRISNTTACTTYTDRDHTPGSLMNEQNAMKARIARSDAFALRG